MRMIRRHRTTTILIVALLLALPTLAMAGSDKTDRDATTGYVVSVDDRAFALRTHDEGVLHFWFPADIQVDPDLAPGNRVTVHYDATEGEKIDGTNWYIAESLDRGTEPDVDVKAEMPEQERMKAEQDTMQANEYFRQREYEALPPKSQGGILTSPIMVGTIVSVEGDALVVATEFGRQTVMIVPQTDVTVPLAKGHDVAIDFHRDEGVVYAAIVREPTMRDQELMEQQQAEGTSFDNEGYQAKAQPGVHHGLTMVGTVESFTDTSVRVKTSTGSEIAVIVPQTETLLELEEGMMVAIDFDRNAHGQIVAKTIRKPQKADS